MTVTNNELSADPVEPLVEHGFLSSALSDAEDSDIEDSSNGGVQNIFELLENENEVSSSSSESESDTDIIIDDRIDSLVVERNKRNIFRIQPGELNQINESSIGDLNRKNQLNIKDSSEEETSEKTKRSVGCFEEAMYGKRQTNSRVKQKEMNIPVDKETGPHPDSDIGHEETIGAAASVSVPLLVTDSETFGLVSTDNTNMFITTTHSPVPELPIPDTTDQSYNAHGSHRKNEPVLHMDLKKEGLIDSITATESYTSFSLAKLNLVDTMGK